jgi:hypothetical protein
MAASNINLDAAIQVRFSGSVSILILCCCKSFHFTPLPSPSQNLLFQMVSSLLTPLSSLMLFFPSCSMLTVSLKSWPPPHVSRFVYKKSLFTLLFVPHQFAYPHSSSVCGTHTWSPFVFISIISISSASLINHKSVTWRWSILTIQELMLKLRVAEVKTFDKNWPASNHILPCYGWIWSWRVKYRSGAAKPPCPLVVIIKANL